MNYHELMNTMYKDLVKVKQYEYFLEQLNISLLQFEFEKVIGCPATKYNIEDNKKRMIDKLYLNFVFKQSMKFMRKDLI